MGPGDIIYSFRMRVKKREHTRKSPLCLAIPQHMLLDLYVLIRSRAG